MATQQATSTSEGFIFIPYCLLYRRVLEWTQEVTYWQEETDDSCWTGRKVRNPFEPQEYHFFTSVEVTECIPILRGHMEKSWVSPAVLRHVRLPNQDQQSHQTVHRDVCEPHWALLQWSEMPSWSTDLWLKIIAIICYWHFLIVCYAVLCWQQVTDTTALG